MMLCRVKPTFSARSCWVQLRLMRNSLTRFRIFEAMYSKLYILILECQAYFTFILNIFNSYKLKELERICISPIGVVRMPEFSPGNSALLNPKNGKNAEKTSNKKCRRN